MISNSTGTIFRIVLIFFTLIAFWFSLVFVPYFILSLIFGFKFSFEILGLFFSILILFRMIYPKNVFI